MIADLVRSKNGRRHTRPVFSSVCVCVCVCVVCVLCVCVHVCVCKRREED